jgi:hypothetical protein
MENQGVRSMALLLLLYLNKLKEVNLNQYFKGRREMKKLLGFLCAVTLVFAAS